MQRIKMVVSLLGAVRHDEQTNLYVSLCPALKLYSAGKNREEAVKALESTVLLFLTTCFERGKLNSVLQQRGFTKTLAPDTARPTMEVAREYIAILEESKFDETFDMTVPLELVAARQHELAGVA